MRKIITSAVLILLFSMFSGSVLADGELLTCADFKASDSKEIKKLFGLCNAYQNALANEDQDTMDDIFATWSKKVGEGGEPKLPGHDYDGGEEPLVTCPCWNYCTLAKAVVDGSVVVAFGGQDPTNLDLDPDNNNMGFDFVSLNGTVNQLYAGNLEAGNDSNECALVGPTDSGFYLQPFAPTDPGEEDVCRLDILNLLAESPLLIPEECPDTP